MRKIDLKGLERAVKELNKTILITRDYSSKNSIDVNDNIKIEILDDARVIDQVSTDNLIKGLIMCSNCYIAENGYPEDVKKVKTKLEKLIRKGAEVEVVKFHEGTMHMMIKINGQNKYNFYGHNFNGIFKMVGDLSKTMTTNLDNVNL